MVSSLVLWSHWSIQTCSIKIDSSKYSLSLFIKIPIHHYIQYHYSSKYRFIKIFNIQYFSKNRFIKIFNIQYSSKNRFIKIFNIQYSSKNRFIKIFNIIKNPKSLLASTDRKRFSHGEERKIDELWRSYLSILSFRQNKTVLQAET